MKQFAKAVSIFAGLVVLVTVSVFATKAVLNRSAEQNANMQAILQTGAEQTDGAVPIYGGEGGGIVIIPDEEVITEEFLIPEDRQAIPIGPGVAKTGADGTDAAGTAQYLHEKAAEFLSEEEYQQAAQALFDREGSEKLYIYASSPAGDGAENGLAKAFFYDFLGVADYASVFSCSRICLIRAQGECIVEYAYSQYENTAAMYYEETRREEDAEIRTEYTEVTAFAGDCKTVVTTTVVTTQNEDGAGVQSSVSSKTLPNG